MSHPVPATLYRIAAAAGCGSAVVLLINAAKRAEVIPTSAFTQLVAPSRRSWRWPVTIRHRVVGLARFEVATP